MKVNMTHYKKMVGTFDSLSSRQRLISSGLFFTILMVSLPAFFLYVLPGHDIWFHLMRIEGIKDGFLSGQFPVRIQPGWLNEHGYATSIMYSELLLYLPALLRWIGLPIGLVYNLYIIGVNIATVLIAYYCFNKVVGDSLCGLMMAVFYSANVYRLSNIYSRSAVGEYTANGKIATDTASFIRFAEFVPQFFVTDYHMTLASQVYRDGMTNEMPLSIGVASALILAAGIKRRQAAEKEKTGALSIFFNQDEYLSGITAENDSVMIDYTSQYNKLNVTLTNPGEQTAIEIPRINYQGYQAKHLESGDFMSISSGNSGRLKIDIPAGFRGTIAVDFVSPFYWRGAELISLLTFLGLSLGTLMKHKKSSTRLIIAWNKMMH